MAYNMTSMFLLVGAGAFIWYNYSQQQQMQEKKMNNTGEGVLLQP